MLRRLPIAFVQVKAGNASVNWLNEIQQIINSLYLIKEIIRKVYNNTINSKQIQCKNGYYIYKFGKY